MYIFPKPTSAGVKLYTQPDGQMFCEYTRADDGKPFIAAMAYDTALGGTRPIKPKLRLGRDAFPKPGMSRAKDMGNRLDSPDLSQPKGKWPARDSDPDLSESDATLSQVAEYLEDKISPEELKEVVAMLQGGGQATDDADEDEADADEEEEKRARAKAGNDRRRQAGDVETGVSGYRRRRTAQDSHQNVLTDADLKRVFPGYVPLKLR